ncbi:MULTISPECIES: N-acetyl-gamma-glutamyl-phosphate reductase [Stenotrophomonas maltophilia group]|uniref:N-acetyl-gamma-glutamyl-phosphate reductase n=1 Tax=Stenotrophomonas maltophilia TaxID=40324 RepID=A0A246HZM7_STEMA|nr:MULTISPECIES: N-acetyl-gamma-glutamyl-phosphate reductase [Stenotrophomonas maltophilia group]MCZ7844385.1 N-acetyl-gamma-glutamyl-phosphate reductase [Stenotrophomonas maltophilia]MDJ1623774.1 N-acetyl-gamma-glutamyl-phosphate reductase [Stenotrophomonas sepilia]OWQ70813.1 N-acetyl-gamma-glutamyl-phosphate reductase [Stenotrophomonas maltophilia]PSD27088.1 N-acetyl-gamma-glutamyl-phosphate reductase [Stenotrophomonas maltophilia]PZT36544.1 N-acetyl-gamma-glutamyl-phosphate reductase [Steno
MNDSTFTLGIVGARGHTGAELIKLVAAHPRLKLAFVSSRERAGQRLSDHHPEFQGELQYENLDADAVAAKGVDAVILALPNGLAAPFVAALETAKPDTVIVDLSADYRFDNSWYYGLPELTRGRYNGQKHISNPGCYATAMQLAVHPLLDLLAGPPQCFGVSGYSGAGTTPSDKNNVELLADNLMPYALTNHVHEREVSVQLGVAVEFMPHVAPHFRGITLTANLWLNRVQTREQIVERFQQAYDVEPLIEVVDEAPWVSRIAGRHGAQVGGFTLAPGGKRVVVVATLDNLLKGAATQAMQNLNLALGIDELTSIPH